MMRRFSARSAARAAVSSAWWLVGIELGICVGMHVRVRVALPSALHGDRLVLDWLHGVGCIG
jgi:hypothetical protein